MAKVIIPAPVISSSGNIPINGETEPPVAGSAVAVAVEVAVGLAVAVAVAAGLAVAVAVGLAVAVAVGEAVAVAVEVAVLPLSNSSHATPSLSASKMYGSPGNRNCCASA
jgi:hypothetical protein